MPSAIAPTYPFDYTGVAPSNLITGEQQILTASNGINSHFIVPVAAPYFVESLVLSIKDTLGNVRPLVNGVDYTPTHWFISASRACAKQVYGSISINDLTLAGVVTLQYQTLGGPWTIDAATIATILADTINNPRLTAWEQVTNYPITFPPIPHQWDLVNMVGMSDVNNSVLGIEQAIINRQTTNINLHIANTNNPHLVTAHQAGAYTMAEVDALVASTGGVSMAQVTASIATETTRATTAETAIQTSVTTETTRALAAEAALQASIAAIPTTGGGTVPTVVSAFTNDVGYQTATQVATTVNTAVAAETTRATAAEAALQAKIPTVPTTVSAFTNDSGYQTSAQVSAAVATETTRAQAAEAALQASITGASAPAYGAVGSLYMAYAGPVIFTPNLGNPGTLVQGSNYVNGQSVSYTTLGACSFSYYGALNLPAGTWRCIGPTLSSVSEVLFQRVA